MRAEIVLTGTELLLGEIVDTNSTKIGKMLHKIGVDVLYKTTVGDNEGRISDVIRLALSRADVVIVSGGLGPTVDDVTRQGIAAATDRHLVYRPDLEAQIAARFAKFGRQMGENNKRQAWIPADAIPIENPVGTAPSFIVQTEQGDIISLPGVPRELLYLMSHTVIPYLKEKLGHSAALQIRVLRTAGLGESDIDRRIDDLMRSSNPTVGLSAHIGAVDIRISAKGDSAEHAASLIEPVEADLRQRLGDNIFGADEETLADVLGQMLQDSGKQLTLLDTLTGGLIAGKLAVRYGNVIAAQHLFDSVADAAQTHNLKINIDPEALATQLANRVVPAAGVGIVVAAPLHAAGVPDEPLAVIATVVDGSVKTFTVRYVYRREAGREWVSVLALNGLRCRLQTSS